MAMDIKGAVKLVRDFVVELGDSGTDIAIAIVIFGAILAAVLGGNVTITTQLNTLLGTIDTNFSGYMTTGLGVLATIAAFIVIVVLVKFFRRDKGSMV